MDLSKLLFAGVVLMGMGGCTASNYCADHPLVCALAIKGTIVEVVLISNSLNQNP